MPNIQGLPPLPVFDGPAQIGVVAERNGKFEAIPASGQSLGLFNRHRSAADAVFQASQHSRRWACETPDG